MKYLARYDAAELLLRHIRTQKPEDHDQLSKAALEENRKHSFQLLGAAGSVVADASTLVIGYYDCLRAGIS